MIGNFRIAASTSGPSLTWQERKREHLMCIWLLASCNFKTLITMTYMHCAIESLFLLCSRDMLRGCIIPPAFETQPTPSDGSMLRLGGDLLRKRTHAPDSPGANSTGTQCAAVASNRRGASESCAALRR